MTRIRLSDLRTHCKEVFDKVAAGESFVVLRRGRPIAEILPLREHVRRQGWKREVKKVRMSGEAISETVIRDREER